MPLPEMGHCPGTLKEGHRSYCSTALRRVFDGHKVSHVLPYDSSIGSEGADPIFNESRRHISISGVQEKFSMILEKNKLRLTKEGERGTYIGPADKPDHSRC